MQARVRDLGAPARLAVFALGLALVGGVAALAGAATGHGRVATGDTPAEAMAMEPMEAIGSSSKTDFHACPPSFDFHTPPEAVPA